MIFGLHELIGRLREELQLIAPSADRICFLCAQYIEMHKASKVKTQPSLPPVELDVEVEVEVEVGGSDNYDGPGKPDYEAPSANDGYMRDWSLSRRTP